MAEDETTPTAPDQPAAPAPEPEPEPEPEVAPAEEAPLPVQPAEPPVAAEPEPAAAAEPADKEKPASASATTDSGAYMLRATVIYEDGRRVQLANLAKPVAIMWLEEQHPDSARRVVTVGATVGDFMLLAWYLEGQPATFEQWAETVLELALGRGALVTPPTTPAGSPG